MVGRKCKHSDELKESIRALAKSGVNIKKIGQDLGIHPNVIYKWVSYDLGERSYKKRKKEVKPVEEAIKGRDHIRPCANFDIYWKSR